MAAGILRIHSYAARRSAKERELLEKYAPPPDDGEPADDTASAALGGVELAAVFDKLPLRGSCHGCRP